MSISRYKSSTILKDNSGQRYLSINKDIDIPKQSDDIYIRWKESDRTTLLANQYYNDPEYYWVILKANNVGIESQLIPGQRIRIPKNINNIISEI